MDLPGYLENIEHSIRSSFTLKSNEIYDVLIKNVGFCPISYETTFLASKISNFSQNIMLKCNLIGKISTSFLIKTLTYAYK